MAEETTEIIKKGSNGSVKLDLEEYKTLMAKAAKEPIVVYNTVEKTPEMAASDHLVAGALMSIAGLALTALGGVLYAIGLKEKKAL